ncbi:MAG: hypothetical protein MRY79_01380 [Alphaproteobacteria bacterium]|nr:hypothetical protein [Alphaproteobacteria bacterium]
MLEFSREIFSNDRPLRFRDDFLDREDLMAALENLEYTAKEAFGRASVRKVDVEGFENRNGMNIRFLMIHFSKSSDQIKRRGFADKWAVATMRENGDKRIGRIEIGYSFTNDKALLRELCHR